MLMALLLNFSNKEISADTEVLTFHEDLFGHAPFASVRENRPVSAQHRFIVIKEGPRRVDSVYLMIARKEPLSLEKQVDEDALRLLPPVEGTVDMPTDHKKLTGFIGQLCAETGMSVVSVEHRQDGVFTLTELSYTKAERESRDAHSEFRRFVEKYSA